MSPSLAKSSEKLKNEIEDYHKGVKYLHESGIQKVPKKYIFPISERPNCYTINENPQVASKHNLKLPVIDFSQLYGPNRAQVLDSLSYACENYGFFQVTCRDILSFLVCPKKEQHFFIYLEKF